MHDPQQQSQPLAMAAGLWRRVSSTAARETLCLPDLEQQRFDALLARAREHVWGQGDALLALFTGKPGTGKSLAARIVAADVGAPVIEIDAIAAAARGPAGAAAMLWLLLREAEQQHAVLVVNDPVALMRALRSEGGLAAHLGRYPGIVILCSRVTVRLPADQAGRFSAVIDFPLPEAPTRERLWRDLLPAGASVGEREIAFLARSFALAGGAIAECCATAGERAAATGRAVTREDIAAALELHFSRWILSAETSAALSALRADPAADG